MMIFFVLIYTLFWFGWKHNVRAIARCIISSFKNVFFLCGEIKNIALQLKSAICYVAEQVFLAKSII